MLQSREGQMEMQELQEEYKNTLKSELGMWKTSFVMLEAVLKMGFGAEVRDTFSPCKKFKYMYPCRIELYILSVDGSLSYPSTILLVLWI